MQYFSKVTGSAMNLAKQSIQVMSAGIVTMEGKANSSAPVMSPQQSLEFNFRAVCELVELLASSNDSKTTEGERKLQQSKVKQHLKEIVAILEDESYRWCKRNDANFRDDVSNYETPCMDIFLQSRMLQELCNRAVLDTPRGCLPLILTTLASLLRSVQYPLLPHMTIHKPIANLISVAVRYDAMHMYTNAANSAVTNSDAQDGEVFNKAEYANYKRKIEIGLISLLRVLWRKFSENPAILDYFTFEDRRNRSGSSHSPLSRLNSSTGTPNSGLIIQTQMDVLNALVTMIGKPRVSLYAQEALLVALNMCDQRIEKFILIQTTFIQQIIADLCKRFQAALDSANEALSMPINSYCGSVGSVSSSLTAGANRTSGPTASTSTRQTTATSAQAPAGPTTASSTSSMLSPLPKLSSFTAGSSSATGRGRNPAPTLAAKAPAHTFNSPSATAVFAFARGALYGSAQAPSQQVQVGMDASSHRAAGANNAAAQSEAKYSPMQTFLRSLRFLVAVAAALRRMSASKRPLSRVRAGSVGREGESASGTYEWLVENFTDNFLQETLRTALQSRGEGMAVAVNIILRNILEEMSTAEHLWASHSASSSGTAAGSTRAPRSLLHVTSQFLCGSLPVVPEGPPADSSITISKTIFSSPVSHNTSSGSMSTSFYGNTSAGATSGQVNYTAMLLARVGSITRLISVSSYLVMCSVLQSAPLSLALEVLLGLPSPHGTSSVPALTTLAESPTRPTSSIPVGTPQPPPRGALSVAPSPATPGTPATPADTELRSLDETLSAIFNSLIIVVHNSLADDLNLSTEKGPQQTPGKSAVPRATNQFAGSDVQAATEFASRNILSRLPGKALWSLLSSDPTTSALSPALLQSLQASADQQSKNGVIEVLQRRLGSFLSMKFDEQVALGALLQRTVCLLSVVVLACQNNITSDRPLEGTAHTSVHYLLQIMEFLKIIDKLWKEIKGYLQRIPSGSAKVPAMRQVLHATAQVEIDNSILFSITCEAPSAESSPAPNAAGQGAPVGAPGAGASGSDSTGRVSIAHKVDSASWKLVEKESAQARSILESAVLLHELRAEVRSYVLAIRSLRALMKDTVGVVPPAVPVESIFLDPSSPQSPVTSGNPADADALDDVTDVAAEKMEDLQTAQAMRLMMVSFGWEAPTYHGAPWNPKTSMSFYQASTYLSQPVFTSVQGPSKSIASSRGSTPSVSTANLSGLVGTVAGVSVRRVPLINNLDLRLEEFLAEYQVLESGLEEIVGSIAVEGA